MQYGNPRRFAAFIVGKVGQPTQRADRFQSKGSAMRSLIIILILVVMVAIAAVATGFVDINQIRGAQAPTVQATGNGIATQGGQAPAFDVATGSIRVGTGEAQVKVPTLEVERPGVATNDAAANAATNAQ
jgi:hypothetical protein